MWRRDRNGEGSDVDNEDAGGGLGRRRFGKEKIWEGEGLRRRSFESDSQAFRRNVVRCSAARRIGCIVTLQ